MSKITSHVEEAGTRRENRYWGHLRGYLGRLRRGSDQIATVLARMTVRWGFGVTGTGMYI